MTHRKAIGALGRMRFVTKIGMGYGLGLLLVAGCGEQPTSKPVELNSLQNSQSADMPLVDATPKPKRPATQETFPDDPNATWTVTLAGVRWRDLATGDGNEVTSGAIAYFHIKTFLANGRQFHSTLVDRKPVVAAIGAERLQRELEEALIGMRERGRRLIEFPKGLSYWSAAHLADGPALPAGESPKFDVTCLLVKMPRERNAGGLEEHSPGTTTGKEVK